MRSFVASFCRFFLCASCMALSSSSSADKYQWEPYPWPNAEYPSREKPMRRDLSEPLQFGEKEPRPGMTTKKPIVKKPAKKMTKTAKKPGVKPSKRMPKARSPKLVEPKRMEWLDSPPTVLMPPPPIQQHILPSTDNEIVKSEEDTSISVMDFVLYIVAFALTVFLLILLF